MNVAAEADVGPDVGPELLAELLACEDGTFIRRAYWVLLGREPDADGLANYLARLGAGASRLQVLSELSASPEANAKNGVALEGAASEPLPAAYASRYRSSNVASSCEELLARQGPAFVGCAYQTLLGRDPDSQGLHFYLGELRRGKSKIQILAQLRHSAELKSRMRDIDSFPRGFAVKRMLRRLDWEIAKFYLARIPVVGWLLRSVFGIEGDSRMEIRLRKMEYRLATLTPAEEDNLEIGSTGESDAAPAVRCEAPASHSRTGAGSSGPSVAPQPREHSLRSLPAPSDWR